MTKEKLTPSHNDPVIAVFQQNLKQVAEIAQLLKIENNIDGGSDWLRPMKEQNL